MACSSLPNMLETFTYAIPFSVSQVATTTKVGNVLHGKHEGLQPREGHVALGRAEGKPADVLRALPARGQFLLAGGKLLKSFEEQRLWKTGNAEGAHEPAGRGEHEPPNIPTHPWRRCSYVGISCGHTHTHTLYMQSILFCFLWLLCPVWSFL